jgi:hypothetical protein
LTPTCLPQAGIAEKGHLWMGNNWIVNMSAFVFQGFYGHVVFDIKG